MKERRWWWWWRGTQRGAIRKEAAAAAVASGAGRGSDVYPVRPLPPELFRVSFVHFFECLLFLGRGKGRGQAGRKQLSGGAKSARKGEGRAPSAKRCSSSTSELYACSCCTDVTSGNTDTLHLLNSSLIQHLVRPQYHLQNFYLKNKFNFWFQILFEFLQI